MQTKVFYVRETPLLFRLNEFPEQRGAGKECEEPLLESKECNAGMCPECINPGTGKIVQVGVPFNIQECTRR